MNFASGFQQNSERSKLASINSPGRNKRPINAWRDLGHLSVEAVAKRISPPALGKVAVAPQRLSNLTEPPKKEIVNPFTTRVKPNPNLPSFQFIKKPEKRVHQRIEEFSVLDFVKLRTPELWEFDLQPIRYFLELLSPEDSGASLESTVRFVLRRHLVLSRSLSPGKIYKPYYIDECPMSDSVQDVRFWLQEYFRRKNPDDPEFSAAPGGETVSLMGNNQKQFKYNCLLLYGKCGAGKTTVVEAICHSDAYSLERVDCATFKNFWEIKKQYAEAVQTLAVRSNMEGGAQVKQSAAPKVSDFFKAAKDQEDDQEPEDDRTRKARGRAERRKVFLLENYEWLINEAVDSGEEGAADKLIFMMSDFFRNSKYPWIIETDRAGRDLLNDWQSKDIDKLYLKVVSSKSICPLLMVIRIVEKLDRFLCKFMTKSEVSSIFQPGSTKCQTQPINSDKKTDSATKSVGGFDDEFEDPFMLKWAKMEAEELDDPLEPDHAKQSNTQSGELSEDDEDLDDQSDDREVASQLNPPSPMPSLYQLIAKQNQEEAAVKSHNDSLLPVIKRFKHKQTVAHKDYHVYFKESYDSLATRLSLLQAAQSPMPEFPNLLAFLVKALFNPSADMSQLSQHFKSSLSSLHTSCNLLHPETLPPAPFGVWGALLSLSTPAPPFPTENPLLTPNPEDTLPNSIPPILSEQNCYSRLPPVHLDLIRWSVNEFEVSSVTEDEVWRAAQGQVFDARFVAECERGVVEPLESSEEWAQEVGNQEELNRADFLGFEGEQGEQLEKSAVTQEPEYHESIHSLNKRRFWLRRFCRLKEDLGRVSIIAKHQPKDVVYSYLEKISKTYECQKFASERLEDPLMCASSTGNSKWYYPLREMRNAEYVSSVNKFLKEFLKQKETLKFEPELIETLIGINEQGNLYRALDGDKSLKIAFEARIEIFKLCNDKSYAVVANQKRKSRKGAEGSSISIPKPAVAPPNPPSSNSEQQPVNQRYGGGQPYNNQQYGQRGKWNRGNGSFQKRGSGYGGGGGSGSFFPNGGQNNRNQFSKFNPNANYASSNFGSTAPRLTASPGQQSGGQERLRYSEGMTTFLNRTSYSVRDYPRSTVQEGICVGSIGSKEDLDTEELLREIEYLTGGSGTPLDTAGSPDSHSTPDFASPILPPPRVCTLPRPPSLYGGGGGGNPGHSHNTHNPHITALSAPDPLFGHSSPAAAIQYLDDPAQDTVLRALIDSSNWPQHSDSSVQRNVASGVLLSASDTTDSRDSNVATEQNGHSANSAPQWQSPSAFRDIIDECLGPADEHFPN